MNPACGCHKPDRYKSFSDIDCDGNARRVMDCIDRQLALPGRDDAFWRHFTAKRRGAAAPDALFLIHAHLNQIRELFEQWDDGEALALLEQLEEECC